MPVTSNVTTIEAGSIELRLVGGEVSSVLYALDHAPSGATPQCKGLAARIETAPRDPDAPHVVVSVPLLADEILVVASVLAEIAAVHHVSGAGRMAEVYLRVLVKIATAPRR